MARTPKSARRRARNVPPLKPSQLRIIGGTFRGRKLAYAGDPRVRPMKDRLREAVFNLVGPAIRDTHAIDLFAGTGALGLEAISRGAARATLVERHVPTARVVRQNMETLGCQDRVQLVVADAFVWSQTSLPNVDLPWVVFCSPPYCLYQDRSKEMQALVLRMIRQAPPKSTVCLEADDHLDLQQLPDDIPWDIRRYPPAIVAMHRT